MEPRRPLAPDHIKGLLGPLRKLMMSGLRCSLCTTDLPSARQTENCTFGESHLIWNLLTALSLSDSLEHIAARTHASDPGRALQQLFTSPAVLLSASLGQLRQLQLKSFGISCRSEAVSRVVLGLLSCSPASRVTTIEIEYRCEHSLPCLRLFEALFTALDTSVAAANFAALRTISVFLS
ncbi:hypothetical protein CERSUDRAFT_101086 [Gelatoporia subvermispora B]|uniref:Uncharacterized protein n=1 Tax=Ceriporiopsis subvermispora (strain B) TaxID=914234 RepID=M2Q1K1_CERS8|nr:hypothetical protein CERSUDRAFT_101086 [Gelatoporia subvermispora B]